jgi:hypothetical protein
MAVEKRISKPMLKRTNLMADCGRCYRKSMGSIFEAASFACRVKGSQSR